MSPWLSSHPLGTHFTLAVCTGMRRPGFSTPGPSFKHTGLRNRGDPTAVQVCGAFHPPCREQHVCGAVLKVASWKSPSAGSRGFTVALTIP